MPVKNYRQLTLIAKLEGTYGSDSSPTGADAILAWNVSIKPLQNSKKERSIITPYFAAKPFVLTERHTSISFEVELAGSGTAGLAPQWGKLIQACGMAENLITSSAATTIEATYDKVGAPTGSFTYTTTTAPTGTVDRLVTLACTTAGGSGVAKFTVSAPAISSPSVAAYNQTNVIMTSGTAFTLADGAQITPTIGTSFAVGDTYTIQLYSQTQALYTPTSPRANHKSISIYCNIDGELHKITGCRGSYKLSMSSNNIPSISFDFIGQFVTPTATAAPTPDYTPWKDPKPVDSTNTIYVSFFNQTLVMSSFGLDCAVQKGLIERVGATPEVRISDRTVSFDISVEAPAVGTLNLYDKAFNANYGYFLLQQGASAGNIVRLIAPKNQIDAPSPKNEQNDYLVDVKANCLPVYGDDEFSIGVM